MYVDGVVVIMSMWLIVVVGSVYGSVIFIGWFGCSFGLLVMVGCVFIMKISLLCVVLL